MKRRVIEVTATIQGRLILMLGVFVCLIRIPVNYMFNCGVNAQDITVSTYNSSLFYKVGLLQKEFLSVGYNCTTFG